MDKSKLVQFLLKSRTKTYASGEGKVKPLLPGSIQYEYAEGDWLYRDVYNIGNGVFAGLETVYYKEKPVLSMSYYGNFKKITEEEADKVLRGALIAKWEVARLWHHVEWKIENYQYTCNADSSGSLDEFSGTEKITKDGQEVYHLYYAGGFIG